MSRLVAVTGATGFIGNHLLGELARQGASLRILARRLPDHPLAADLAGRTSVELVQGDMSDERALGRLISGADAVVHLAGAVKARRREAYFEANAQAVESIARSLASSETPGRLVLVSSLAAREPELSDYAASKRAGEAALARHDSFDWCILRPPAVYGPGDRETLALFSLAARGWAPVLGRPGARLSLIDARDLAAAIAALVVEAPSGSSGVTYEVDDGRPGGYGWEDVVAAAGRAVGRRLRTPRVPGALALALAALGDVSRLGLGGTPMLTIGKLREIHHPDWVVQGRRLQDETSWRPSIDIDRGFHDAVDWYRRMGWL